MLGSDQETKDLLFSKTQFTLFVVDRRACAHKTKTDAPASTYQPPTFIQADISLHNAFEGAAVSSQTAGVRPGAKWPTGPTAVFANQTNPEHGEGKKLTITIEFAQTEKGVSCLFGQVQHLPRLVGVCVAPQELWSKVSFTNFLPSEGLWRQFPVSGRENGVRSVLCCHVFCLCTSRWCHGHAHAARAVADPRSSLSVVGEDGLRRESCHPHFPGPPRRTRTKSKLSPQG